METEAIESDAGVDVERFLVDTLHSCTIESPIPEVTRQQECCMGIDEAGRGPVLGWSILIFQIEHTINICFQVLWCMAPHSVPCP